MPCRDDCDPDWDRFVLVQKLAIELFPHSNYGRASYSRENLRRITQAMCTHLKKGVVDIKKYSLDLQIWWRDHQIADKKREQEERTRKADVETLKTLYNKLTQSEKQALRRELSYFNKFF